MTQYELAFMALHAEPLRMRVRYLMTKAVLAKLAAQAPSDADKLLGQSILNGAEPLDAWALGALTNPSIAAGAHTLDGASILDGDLEFAVNSLWAAFAI